MRFRFVAAALPLATALAGCVSDQPPSVWVRTDGQRMAGNAALEQKSEIDKTICQGEAQKAGLSNGQPLLYPTLTSQILAAQAKDNSMMDVAKGCMASRGYVLVPQPEAEARLAAYAATAGQTQTASR